MTHTIETTGKPNSAAVRDHYRDFSPYRAQKVMTLSIDELTMLADMVDRELGEVGLSVAYRAQLRSIIERLYQAIKDLS